MHLLRALLPTLADTAVRTISWHDAPDDDTPRWEFHIGVLLTDVPPQILAPMALRVLRLPDDHDLGTVLLSLAPTAAVVAVMPTENEDLAELEEIAAGVSHLLKSDPNYGASLRIIDAALERALANSKHQVHRRLERNARTPIALTAPFRTVGPIKPGKVGSSTAPVPLDAPEGERLHSVVTLLKLHKIHFICRITDDGYEDLSMLADVGEPSPEAANLSRHERRRLAKRQKRGK